MDIHRDLVTIFKILLIAFAVGLDVLAVSIGIGVARLPAGANLRLGLTFAGSEIVMQALGYLLGAHAGGFIGNAAAYAGFILLGVIGALMLRKSLAGESSISFNPSTGGGALMTAMSISLDSFGVGMAVAVAAIPFVPLLITISITTTLFTFAGLAFGDLLGGRIEQRAESVAGLTLIVLAVGFTLQRLL